MFKLHHTCSACPGEDEVACTQQEGTDEKRARSNTRNGKGGALETRKIGEGMTAPMTTAPHINYTDRITSYNG